MADIDEFLDEWAASGLTAVTLPSGYQVRLRLPQPRDLIVRGLLPRDLIARVLERSEIEGGMDRVQEEDPELAIRLLEAQQTLAADSIRQTRKSSDEPWRPIEVKPERFAMLPEADREAVVAVTTAAMSAADVAEGASDRAKREGAAGTVDAYAEFRGKPAGNARRGGRKPVRPAAVDDDRPAGADGGAGSRRRAGRATRGG